MHQPDAVLARFLPLHPKLVDLSLGRTERLLARLGNPERRLPPVIHVAGTNGKGSTVAFLRAGLEAAGRRVHVYTSPHLVRFNERIRLGAVGGGALVEDDELMAVLDECERANGGEEISTFEITTAAAFVLFARRPADVVLLEVGLGGRFDATNVVADPAVCVITPVSMDHPEFLGATVDRIAFEKAGIFKRGAGAVMAAQVPEADAVLRREARRLGLAPLVADEDYSAHEEHGRLVFQDGAGLVDLPLPRLPGRHQHQNAATAIATLRLFDPALSTAHLEAALAGAEWPARMQRLTRGPLVDIAPLGAELWLDGGHNEEGGRVLAAAMADLEDGASRPLVLVVGMLARKDVSGFLRSFRGLAQEMIAVPVAGGHEARAPAQIAAAAIEAGIRAASCESFEGALDYLSAREWPVPPRILLTGSLYLAGEVLSANRMAPR